MRLAYVSPLPPQKSGIADYSAELLPHLAAAAEVSLFWEGEERPVEELRARFSVQPLRELPAAAERGRFDAILYQLGNAAEYHGETYRTLLSHPGVVVLHEYMLHHLVRQLTLVRGDFPSYFEELRYCCGKSGARAARRFFDTAHPIDEWSFPLFERVVDRSSGVVVHSEFARRRLLASRPLARVRVMPFPLELAGFPASCAAAADAADANRRGSTSPGAARLRAALGLPVAAPIFASFGFVTPQKHLEPALAAFARLRREIPEALFLVVGECSPFYDFAEVLRRLGAEGVVVTGRVDQERLFETMAACDVAVNLRHPSGGETSATLIRLLGLGKPVVVTKAGSFAELPPGCCAQVEVDECEEEVLLALLRRLARDPVLRAGLGDNARRHVEAKHAPAASARLLLDFLAEVVAEPRLPRPAPPPLAPCREPDQRTALIAELGAAIADLGQGEAWEEGLAALARELVDLDLDPGARERAR